MCLGVPGIILSRFEKDGLQMANADCGGAKREICLLGVPDAVIGSYVMIHAGFAISQMNEAEALATLCVLDELDEVGL